MTKLFPVYEIGSLPKLNVRAKAFAAENPTTEEDITELTKYGKIAGVDVSGVVEILLRQKAEKRKLTSEEKAA